MQLHLFSSPGERDIRYILEASRPYLEQASQPVVAYFPAAAWRSNWLEYTKNAFAGLGEIAYIDCETMALAEIQAILDRATVLYISGGNTFLLNHRIHHYGLFTDLRRRLLDGLPLVAFSAGSIICGPNMLTANDMNLCATTHFESFNLLSYNFDMHYPTEEAARNNQADWLLDYHAFHDNPILALQDGAYLYVNEQEVTVKQGVCWLIEKRKTRRQVTGTLPIALE
ncbi:MAG: Type 1 glutamine amidotransferase-like domain-containing protein [Caldilineaceae bacterium]